MHDRIRRQRVEVSLVAEGAGWHLTVDDVTAWAHRDAATRGRCSARAARRPGVDRREHMGLRLLRDGLRRGRRGVRQTSPLGGVQVGLIRSRRTGRWRAWAAQGPPQT